MPCTFAGVHQWAHCAPRGALHEGAAASHCPPTQALAIDLALQDITPVPAWGGRFECRPGVGLALADLHAAELRPRVGGERFQLAPNSLPRGLKKQYQALAVPAHARSGPLVWAGQRLLYVPGLGMDARALATAGQPQAVLHWRPDVDDAGLLQRSR